jgi:hypothetical protein
MIAYIGNTWLRRAAVVVVLPFRLPVTLAFALYRWGHEAVTWARAAWLMNG